MQSLAETTAIRPLDQTVCRTRTTPPVRTDTARLNGLSTVPCAEAGFHSIAFGTPWRSALPAGRRSLELMFERDAFRVVFIEPGAGFVRGSEFPDRVALVVNPDRACRHLKLSLTRCIAGWARFLTLTQLGEVPAR
jgi:hypothetical protein